MIRTPGAVVGPVMPQVTGTWGHKLWCEAQSRNYPLPCPGHCVYYIMVPEVNCGTSYTKRPLPMASIQASRQPPLVVVLVHCAEPLHGVVRQLRQAHLPFVVYHKTRAGEHAKQPWSRVLGVPALHC